MREMEKQIRIEEVLYLCFFSLMLIAKGIGLYDGQLLYKIFFIVAMLCVINKICITTYTLKEWVAVALMGILTVIVYFVSKEKGIILCMSTVIALKNVSSKKVFKVGAWIWGTTMLGNLLYHLVFLNTSGYKIHEKLGLGHIFRWDLGFSHPNVLHIAYLTLVAFIIYNLGEKYNWKNMLLLMCGNIFIFMYSVSYTGVIVVTLYLGLAWYVNIRKELCAFEYFLLEMIFPCCLILSFLSPFILPEKIFNIVNKIFSTRLSLSKYFLVEENIKLLGNNLEQITTYQHTMDNTYVFSFVIYGVLFFILLVIGYAGTIHYCVKNGKNNELAMLVSFLVAGITEPFMFNTSFKNLTLLFVGSYFWYILDDRTKEKKVYSIFRMSKGSLKINFSYLEKTKRKVVDVWYNKKKKIILFSCLLGVLVGICTITVSKKPEGYIVPRKHTDMKDEETWYLEDEEDSRYSGYVVMDFENPETKMQIYTGNIVIVEQVRRCVASIIIIVMTYSLICLVVEIIREAQIGREKE